VEPPAGRRTAGLEDGVTVVVQACHPHRYAFHLEPVLDEQGQRAFGNDALRHDANGGPARQEVRQKRMRALDGLRAKASLAGLRKMDCGGVRSFSRERSRAAAGTLRAIALRLPRMDSKGIRSYSPP